MKRTYLDASVLIAAFQGEDAVSRRALAVLDDPTRMLVVSDYVRLEVLPKPAFHRRREEVAFMEAVCGAPAENVLTSPEVAGRALELACKYDLTPVDALHIGTPLTAAVDELVTMEKANRPMCRVREVKVLSLHSGNGEQR